MYRFTYLDQLESLCIMLKQRKIIYSYCYCLISISTFLSNHQRQMSPCRQFIELKSHLADVRWRALLPGEKSRMFHQVDEEVGGAVEHGEEVGQLGDVLDPVGPLQLTLHNRK
jgi:hypothetical protein